MDGFDERGDFLDLLMIFCVKNLIFQVLERVLEECGDDIDAAIKRLNEFHIGYGDENAAPAAEPNENVQKGIKVFILFLFSVAIVVT